ncbi:hypothetical protein C0J29_31510 (plasmid) [Mycobacterium paragordonae]|uniref:DUF202 domain-containing protein n=1 Tax=Mycobacterium paragordonae TaxID=1389713 RepID=A0ABQ1CFJ6_9MYCO|nr:hypothetical protein C0J29_31510 [Mycobacterium paragordonae]GFG83030.1 hypothetical protein MPRG_63060 [Mycobacterium paragordonae]
MREHAARGSRLIYFAAALLAVAIGLVVLRLREHRTEKPRVIIHLTVGIIVLVVGISSTIQVYRVADIGGHSVWDEELERMQQSRGT